MWGEERHLHEECGVFGVCSPKEHDVASLTYYGLFALQHRGQESAGIVVNDRGCSPPAATWDWSVKYFLPNGWKRWAKEISP